MVEIRKGNLLLQKDLDVIGHQANCFNCLGGGIAFQIAQMFPEAEEVDDQTIKGDGSKLGTFTITKNTKPFLVANIYGQYHLGKDIRYDSLKQGIESLLKHMKKQKLKSLGLPYKIGCGIAGGDWNIVFRIIKEIQENNPEIKIILVEYP